MSGWKVFAISLGTSIAVTGTILFVAMRRPLPLLDTAASKAVFEDQSAAQKAA